MASERLIPIPIVDKNGVVSIRYKKDQNSVTSVPVKAPSVKAQSVSSPAMERLDSGLEDVFASEGYGGIFMVPDLLHRRLKEYDPSVIKGFDDTVASKLEPHDRLNCLALLASCLNNDLGSEAAGYMLFSVQTTDFYFDWSDQHNADLAYSDAYRAYVGVQSMLDEDYWDGVGWTMPANILEADELDAERYRALLRVTLYLHEADGTGLEWVNGEEYSYYSGFRLEDKDAYKFILQHPDTADQIISLIDERGGLQPGVVEQVLTSPARAVSDGVL